MAALKGPYDLLPSQEDYTVIAPNGDAPSEGALLSHRYHHHTQPAVHDGRIWVHYSSSGTNEDAGGQMTLASSSPLEEVSFGGPVQIVPPQSAFDPGGDSYQAGTRISYPRKWVIAEGLLYSVCAIEEIAPGGGGGAVIGKALLARECRGDGTVGPLFRVSSAAYAPVEGFAAVPYDAELAPLIFPEASIFGMWGGSHPSYEQSDWIGWTSAGGIIYTEPATVDLGFGHLLRFWRRIDSPTGFLFDQHSFDGGSSWGDIRQTTVPNPSAVTAALKLQDGRIALVGNPQLGDDGVVRDPLFLALFPAQSYLGATVYAVRQGLSDDPAYAGTFKTGGAAYPGLWQDGDDLWISYSMQKETIGVTRLALQTV